MNLSSVYVMGTALFLTFLFPTASTAASKSNGPTNDQLTTFGQIAKKESAKPIRPGMPGKTPFWNKYAKRFIYAPAFDFKPVDGAVKYRFDIAPKDAATSLTFTADEPYAPLSPVWTNVPVGPFDVTVTGVSTDDKDLKQSGHGHYYRAAWFNGVYYAPPVMPYDKSAVLALDNLMKQDYVQYWLDHGKPDPTYKLYRYPAKIFSALIVGAVTAAKLHTDAEGSSRSIKLARSVADYLIGISYPATSKWAYFPPTYHGKWMRKSKKPHMKPENCLTIMGADGGNAYLDLYDMTSSTRYLDAAKRIADPIRKIR